MGFEGEEAMIDSDTVVEHGFTCPYCWEEITMVFDLSVAEQSYVEDCEVCCSPIALRFNARNGMVVFLDVRQLA
jgi:transcription elongation factor Elf1